MDNYKLCTRCNQSLSIDLFHKMTSAKTGYASACKLCIKQSSKDYRQTNSDKLKIINANYYQKNKLVILEKQRLYIASTQEARKLYRVTWRERNRIAIRNYANNYSKNNPEKLLTYRSNKSLEQKEKDKIAKRRWAKNNQKLVNEKTLRYRAKKSNNGVYKIAISKILKLYQSPCFYCGTKSQIELDHVIPIARGGQHSIGNLVAACRACNGSKGSKTIMEWRKWRQ